MIRQAALLRYLGRGAVRGLLASPVTSAMAILTIVLCLLIVGSFGLLAGNMQSVLDHFGQDLRITAYLEADLDPEAERALRDTVATVEGVAAVELVSREEALARFKKSVGSRTDLLEGLSENPLPTSLEVELQREAYRSEGLRRLVEALEGLPGIQELAAGQEWVEGYARMLRLVRVGSLGLGSVLLLAAFLIVANTIRLTVYARRDELEILGLVGASRVYVSIPFLLEGLIQGALGGLVALVLLFGLFQLVLPGVGEGLRFFLGFVEPRFYHGGEIAMLLATGCGLGVLGSGAALVQGWRP